MTTAAMTREEALELPATTDLETACRALGIGRTVGYTLAKHEAFPTPVLRVGKLYRVPTEPLLEALGIARPTSSPA